MKRLLAVFAAALAIGLCSGCSLLSFTHIPLLAGQAHSSAPRPPKESSHIATESEKDFKVRWVAKRTADLVAQGLAPDAARAQATTEFDQKFSATHVARQ
jgi:hypothetical protein